MAAMSCAGVVTGSCSSSAGGSSSSCALSSTVSRTKMEGMFAAGECDIHHPYTAVDHAGDLWGFGVGLPPEHDHAPDVTHRGWMRLAVPDVQDSNRARWKTDPLWQIVQ